MRSTFDLIVVGAGPGGSSAVAAALRHGLTVAQVDRCQFPRIKPCGGGFTIKASRVLGMDLLPVLRGEHNDVEVNVWQRRSRRFTHRPSALIRMVVRSQFDEWLVSRNLGSPGFRFFPGERVIEISWDGVFRVRTPRMTLAGRQLVGADGAYSLVNRQFSISRPKGSAVAVEVTISRDQARLAREIPPCFDLGAIDSGYGWVFPKDDHWNVGLYTLGKSKALRDQLASYIAAKGFMIEADPLASFEAHRFPYGGYRLAVPQAPVYVVGDAGGFGDALTGEGIYYALESGRLAGQTAHDMLAGASSHSAYYRRLRRSVLADTFLTYITARAFYGNVDRAMTLLERSRLWRLLLRGYAAGATMAESLRGGLKLPRLGELGMRSYA